MAPIDVRKGMPSVELSREEFEKRYRSRFADPAFRPLQRQLDAIVAAAWMATSITEKRLTRARPVRASPIRITSSRWIGSPGARLFSPPSGAMTTPTRRHASF
jgi:hypothetical protein